MNVCLCNSSTRSRNAWALLITTDFFFIWFDNDDLIITSALWRSLYHPTSSNTFGQWNFTPTLQWRHNEHGGVSNHRRLDCLVNRLFRRRSKKTLKLRVAGLCEENPAVTGGVPSQRASKAENVSTWWRNHGLGLHVGFIHYTDVTMSPMASQITCLGIVYSTIYSGADQRKLQSSASLAFVRRIHWGPVNSPHRRPVTRKMFPFDDVIMYTMPHPHIYGLMQDCSIPLLTNTKYWNLALSHWYFFFILLQTQYAAGQFLRKPRGFYNPQTIRSPIHITCDVYTRSKYLTPWYA